MLKKISREGNFKKVTKIFLRLLNERSRKLKVLKILYLHGDIKIKIFRGFEVAKCFKGEEVFLNNAVN